MDYKNSFLILSSILFVWAFVSLFLVVEPPDLKSKKIAKVNNGEKALTVKQLLVLICKSLKRNKPLAIGIFVIIPLI